MLLVLLVLPQNLAPAQSGVTIDGDVRDHSTGNPIPHANVLVARSVTSYSPRGLPTTEWQKVSQLEADVAGHFVLELSIRVSYKIYVYYDDSSTPGFDYIPSVKSILASTPGKMNLTFVLWGGATLFLDEEALFVETTEPSQSSYWVSEPDSGAAMQFGEYLLHYASGETNLNYFLGISQSQLVVPANIPFMVRVESGTRVEGKAVIRTFSVDQPNHFTLGRGEAVHADLRAFCLPLSLSTVKAESARTSGMIEETEREGFYLAVERQSLAKIISLTLEAEQDLSQGAYGACFIELREAYLEVLNVQSWVAGAYVEASRSVFVLMPFLAFTATAISYLLFEKRTRKVLGSLAFYTAFLPVLYLLYPGSHLVEPSLFLEASLLSIVAILGITALSPRVLEDKVRRRDVPLRNMIEPVFSIAKRSLRRRKLRFALTLTSVMVLVSSFIALTSFTTGFGLTFGQVSSRPGPSEGILVRAPIPPSITTVVLMEKEEIHLAPSWFFPLDNSSIQWFEARTETRLVAPRYENLPCRLYRGETVGYLGGIPIYGDRSIKWPRSMVPIYGVIGVTPSAEAEILRLNETIVEGGYLSDGDDNGVLISRELKERLNATVGETITLRTSGKTLELEIIGIFDDKEFEDLRDLDGDFLLPRKIEAHGIGSDGFTIYIEKLTPCLANETLVITWSTALKLESSGVSISRLDVLLKEGTDLKEYARTMALNRGFRVWASAEDGIYLAELASYFEGKGLPIAIPWGIVVLNMVVTMLNSLYERRREISIYSAVGMNPSHITGLFLAEAALIGVVGGGMGYLLGLGWYKAMSSLALAVQVKQKVSALWVLGAIAVALAAVLVGGLVAIKGSVVVTPSLMRRWRVREESTKPMAFQELTLPIKVSETEAERFSEHMVKGLEDHRYDMEFVTDWIRKGTERREKGVAKTVEFTYREAGVPKKFYSRNKVLLTTEKGEDTYTVKLLSEGNIDIYRIGSLVRKIAMEWSIERGKLEEKI